METFPEAKYLHFYRKAQEILDKHNPCDPQLIDGKMTCAEGRFYNKETHFCCSGCEHLTPVGCGVKALSCKLWLCPHVAGTRPEVQAELSAILREARLNLVPIGYVRRSLEQCKDLYEHT